ncbi:MAG: amidohydrolase [Planctomycetes bacterium]|nr:amidohydrolase [Planctomycetota bacterium]
MSLRRDLHRIAEPSGREVKTAARVARELARMGLTVTTGVAGTGVTADFQTGRPGPFVLLRADMDALEIEDRSPGACRSLNPGYSHACGHDGHTAILVGVVEVLKHWEAALAGRVRFVFQPAEELATGARAMLAAGVMADGRPDAVLALHGWPGLSIDTVASRPGVMGASHDAFTIEVRGRGGHSARPDQARNPLDGMARLLQALPALSSSQRVVTICTARAGTSDNVIPDRGTLTGTSRALDEGLRQRTKEEIRERTAALVATLGLSATVAFREGCPPVVNDGNLFAELRAVGKTLDPHLRVREVEAPSMGAEDFAVFLAEAPGLLIRLGMGPDSPLLHTPEFAFNDEAVPTGMLALAGMVLRVCGRKVVEP